MGLMCLFSITFCNRLENGIANANKYLPPRLYANVKKDLTMVLTFAKVQIMTIQRYMEMKNIPRKDMAKALNISQAYLSQICTGKRKASKYLALVIESRTSGAVTAKSLRPDIEKIA